MTGLMAAARSSASGRSSDSQPETALGSRESKLGARASWGAVRLAAAGMVVEAVHATVCEPARRGGQQGGRAGGEMAIAWQSLLAREGEARLARYGGCTLHCSGLTRGSGRPGRAPARGGGRATADRQI
jgi:hypothetical protein